MRFTTIIRSGGGTTTGIEVPQEVMDALGGGRRYPVVVTLNGYTYRSTVSWYKGVYAISLSAENRAGAAVAAGDEVEVQVELDDAPRDVPVPDDLAAAWDDEGRRFFESLSVSGKKAFTVWIEEAKKPETRASRVSTAVDMLREHRKR